MARLSAPRAAPAHQRMQQLFSTCPARWEDPPWQIPSVGRLLKAGREAILRAGCRAPANLQSLKAKGQARCHAGSPWQRTCRGRPAPLLRVAPKAGSHVPCAGGNAEEGEKRVTRTGCSSSANNYSILRNPSARACLLCDWGQGQDLHRAPTGHGTVPLAVTHHIHSEEEDPPSSICVEMSGGAVWAQSPRRELRGRTGWPTDGLSLMYAAATQKGSPAVHVSRGTGARLAI